MTQKWILSLLALTMAAGYSLRLYADEPATTATPTPAPKEESEGGLRETLKSFLLGDQASDEGVDDPQTMDDDPAELFSPQDTLREIDMGHAVEWHAPDFSHQESALGWKPDVFDVPPALQSRVNFWKDVYTKYSSNQGILHDRNHYEIIYETLDFKDIMKDQSLSIFQKAKAREKLVKARRQEITETLKSLQKVKSADGLTGVQLKIWKLWENVQEPDKFKQATAKARVRFQLGQRDHFLIGIYYSGRYLHAMEKLFREEQLPVELTRLPFVESSFNIHARSKVGASGIWQVMRRTAHARPLRLKVNRNVDERNDPLRASVASSHLLEQNYQILQTWPLAITAYNHGSTGLKKIVGKMKTHDLSTIVAGYSSRRFGFASENFYSCFLAALDVERNAKKYFGAVKWAPEIDAQEIHLTQPIPFETLVKFYDGDSALTQLANPHLLTRLRSKKTNVPVDVYVRVPAARATAVADFQSGKIAPAALADVLKGLPMSSGGSPASAKPLVLDTTAPADLSTAPTHSLRLNPSRDEFSLGPPRQIPDRGM